MERRRRAYTSADMSQVLGLDHLAIAVDDLDAATSLWRDRFGLRVGTRETVAAQGVEVQMMHAGDTRIELICPTSPDSPIAGFLAKRGPGLHHLALAVDDCQGAIDRATEAGARMLQQTPQPGAHGSRIAFVHPQTSGGVLTELVTPATPPDASTS